MSDQPSYFTTAGLCLTARVSRATFYAHVKADVGQITKAKERLTGLGIRWHAGKCRKYLDLVTARTGRKEAAV